MKHTDVDRTAHRTTPKLRSELDSTRAARWSHLDRERIRRFGRFEIDPMLYELRSRGAVVPLRPQLFDILWYLVRKRHRVVSKAELRDVIWEGRMVSRSSLATCINCIRHALGDSGEAPRFIQTIHGRGYRFIAVVEE